MKNPILIFCLFICALSLNAQTAKTPVKASGKTEISNLFIYDVMLYDTTKAENVMKNWEGMPISSYNEHVEHRYLDVNQSRNLRNELGAMMKRKDVLFWNGWDELWSSEKARQKTTIEIQVSEEDSVGNIVGIKTLSDTIDVRKWSKVTFYEEWMFNKANGMLEKNVLGYRFEFYDVNKDLWRPMFGVVKDKTAFEKIKKHTSY
jgi:hypothetical protein